MHTELTHPLVKHRLSILRDKTAGMKLFRESIGELARFLVYEALRGAPTEGVVVETPLAVAQCEVVKGEVVLVPILRAGLGMLDAAREMLPDASVGFLGMYRDHATAQPVEYYSNIPDAQEDSIAVVLDPMLATGGSAAAGIAFLKKHGFKKIILVCIIASAEGVARIEEEHPDTPIFTAAIDQDMNAAKYIVPGLGDAGDRIFGTI